jgi:5-methylcytosine-specific restriction endonuclease McrA
VSLAVIERGRRLHPVRRRPPPDADHVIPREERGPDVPANLETLCVSCHGRATAAERRA